jgi:NAD-dependent SIR2 family protein deacetylase
VDPIDVAAELVAGARSLIVTAGAGMGVDSGLPDFRGPEGFWRAYPPYRGKRFEEMANPKWFFVDPELAWGFYGHRLELYRRTTPHEGFAILRGLCETREHFVFTSNVDGHFQRAGFAEEHVVECHGALSHLQCTKECGAGIFSAEGVRVDVDEETFRARSPLPACRCGALARPNVLMFGDWGWDETRTAAQQARLEAWARRAPEPVVVIECGAGTGVPTVRSFGERSGARLVRINVREPEGPRGTVSIALGALEALRGVRSRLSR